MTPRTVVILLSLGAMVLLQTGCSKQYRVKKLDCGMNRFIIIDADRFHENIQPIYYRVEVDGKIVVPETFISSIEPDSVSSLRPKIVANRSGTIVGVVEERHPAQVWILHNFATGESSPNCGPSGSSERCEQISKALIRELQQVHPELELGMDASL